MSNKKLHHKFGIVLNHVDHLEQLKTLANTHHAVLVDSINFTALNEFEQWVSLFSKFDCNNQSLDYQGLGTRERNVLTISQAVNTIPPGGMPYMNTYGTGSWHQDRPHRQRNSNNFTVIYSHRIPEVGGDTIICDLGAAWDDLSDSFQNILKSLTTLNINRANDLWTYDQIINHRQMFEQELDVPAQQQPLVVADCCGRKTLNFSPKNCVGIVGMHSEESMPIIKFLREHVTKPEYQYRHNWKVGQVLIFSNVHTCHYGVRDYYDQPRQLWQTIIEI
jgi:alpha-ketoglutarate-dependent taurine dioxygenase